MSGWERSLRKANPIEFLFACAKADKRVTDTELADKMGLSRGGLNRKIHRDATRWTLGDIADFAVALSVPMEDVLDAFEEWWSGLYG